MGLFYLMSKLSTTPTRATVVALGLVSALLIGIYWPGLHGAFFFDDGPSILLAPGVRFDEFSWESLRRAWLSGGAGPSGRPIAQLSFALNYNFNGFSPLAFKSTNLAIHATCGVLVLGLARNLLLAVTPTISLKQASFISGAIAVSWVLHPIQLLPVLHAVQRMTGLSALFLLAAFCLHIGGRVRGGRKGTIQLMIAWVGLWPLSCLSKETGLLFPGYVLAWELLIHRSTLARIDTFARVLTVLSAVGALALSTYLVSSSAQWLWAGYDLRSFSMAERVLTEGRVLWFYLGLIFLPRLSSFGLYHDDIEISTGWLAPWTTLPAALALLALMFLAWYLRKRSPLVAFGIVWFFIGHSMESTVLPLEIAHEHRNYLPLFGVLLATAGGLSMALQSPQLLSIAAKRGILAGGGLVLLALTVITALRSYQFGNEIRRTQMAAQDHPRSALSQYEAGSTLVGIPELIEPHSELHERARGHFVLANELSPHFKMGELGLIYLSCKIGEIPQSENVEGLALRLRDTPFAPGDRSLLYSIKEMTIDGKLCLSRLETDNLFAAAIENPTVTPSVQAMLLSWHADYLWLHERDLSAARSALGRSLALNPINSSNRLKWAQLLYISGDHAAALRMLLVLRGENLSGEESTTLEELLARIDITPQ